MDVAEGSYEALASRLRDLAATTPYLRDFTERCLNSMRWEGSAVLMVVDAALTSMGLSYFTAVIPKVLDFRERFYETGLIASLKDLADADESQLLKVWRSPRAWSVAKGVARALLGFRGRDDREKLRSWASQSTLDNWRRDPVGSLKGVGLVTYQYLRMMGGVDTTMPDRVVKRFIAGVGLSVGVKVPTENYEFIKFVEEMGRATGFRPIEATWLSWLIESEGDKVLSERYSKVISLI